MKIIVTALFIALLTALAASFGSELLGVTPNLGVAVATGVVAGAVYAAAAKARRRG